MVGVTHVELRGNPPLEGREETSRMGFMGVDKT